MFANAAVFANGGLVARQVTLITTDSANRRAYIKYNLNLPKALYCVHQNLNPDGLGLHQHHSKLQEILLMGALIAYDK